MKIPFQMGIEMGIILLYFPICLLNQAFSSLMFEFIIGLHMICYCYCLDLVLDLWVFGLISIFACKVFDFFELLKLVRFSYVACGSRRSFGL